MRALTLLGIGILCAGCPPEKTTNVGLGNPDAGKTYTIAGEVRGLSGTGLILRLNGVGDLTVPKAGPYTFTFAIAVDAGADYEVTVLTQPLLPTQACTVTNGTGIATEDVTNVIVDCTTSHFLVGGAVSGLFGSGLVLDVNGQTKTVSANGAFTFDTALEDLSDYTVSVATQPQAPAQICLLQAASGRINGRNVDTVRVDCRTQQVPAFVSGTTWNTYVTKGATTLTTPDNATACDAMAHTRYSECVHAGETQVFVLHGQTSCAGLKATDALGAFVWTCTVPNPGDPPRFVSLGLAPGKRLRDLLDTSTRTFKTNSVTVVDGSNATVATSASSAWWTNPIKVATNTTLNEANTIYLVDTNGAYTITADNVSVVITAPPGLGPPPTAPPNVQAIIALSGRAFAWIDGKISAASAADYGVLVQNSRFVVLRGVTADNADSAGLRIENGAANALFDVVATNNARGVELANTVGVLGLRVVSVRSTTDGVTMTATSGALFDDLATVTNGGAGLVLSGATNNDFGALRANNNTSGGVALTAGSDHNRFSRATITSNGGAQLALNASDGNWWLGLTGALGSTGIDNIAADGNRVAQAAFASMARPVRCAGGTLEAADPTTDNLALDATCVSGPTGPTAALDTAFVGMVIVSDPVNPVDSNGLKQRSVIDTSTGLGGWYLFQNPFRAWGKSVPSAFLDPTQQGACTTLDCRIYDWSLKTTVQSPLRAKFAAPASTDAIVHTWTNATTAPLCDAIPGATFAGTCTSTFLPHAIEIAHDEIGNNNWLCESNEACMLAPNIGSYQGHGLGASTTIGTGGTVENVALVAPAENDGTKQ